MIEIPRQPSPELFHILQWPKAAIALHMIATSGSSVRFEIAKAVAQQFCIRQDSGSLVRMLDQLDTLGLTETQKFSIVCRIHLVAIRLTPKGKAFCSFLGWETVDNDWERLLRLHSADSQPRHAGAVMAFAFGARQRGWKVQVLPKTGIPRFYPDALVEKGSERHYVEVELGNRKEKKWLLSQKAQGHVALCARTPARRASLIDECASLGVYGIATDILTLYKNRDEPDHPLWDQIWNQQDNFAYSPVRYFEGDNTDHLVGK